MRRRLFLICAVGLASIVLAIAACAPTAAPAAPAAAPAAAKQPAAPAPAAAPAAPTAVATAAALAPAPAAATKLTPKRGGTLTIAVGSPYASGGFDPYTNSTQALQALGCCYLQLQRAKDDGVGRDYKVSYKPYLAESWDIAPDGKSITFHLRKGVKWAPLPPLNGREVTAEDVKYSFDRLSFDPRSSVRGAFLNLNAKVEVVDKYTVKLISSVPSSLLMENSHNHPAWIIPKEVVEKEGSISNTMIGAGPYYLEKTVTGVGFTLVRNPNFYDAPRPYPDVVKWMLVYDKAALTAAYRSGQLDQLGSVSKTERDQILKTNPQSQVALSTRKGMGWFVFKADEPDAPWADKRVRVAVSKAIDRRTMLNSLGGGEGYWTGAFACGFEPAYCLTQEETERIYNLQYDVGAAKQLMKEAGYPNGFKAIVNNWSVPSQMLMGMRMLKENLNIELELKLHEHASFIADGFTGRYKQIIYIGIGGGSWKWFQYPTFTYHSKGKWHASQMNSPALDRMIDDMFATLDQKEQIRKSREIQYYLLSDDLLYHVGGVQPDDTTLIQPWIRDYTQVAIDTFDYVDVWINK